MYKRKGTVSILCVYIVVNVVNFIFYGLGDSIWLKSTKR